MTEILAYKIWNMWSNSYKNSLKKRNGFHFFLLLVIEN